MRVLLVEDDRIAAPIITAMLKGADVIVDEVDTGKSALELVRRSVYDIIVLDLLLPDMEGYEVVRRIRAAQIRVPILILSDPSQPDPKVKAFKVGADDFLTAAPDDAELVARLRTLIRRNSSFSQPTLRVGALQLNLDSCEVTVDDKHVHLTDKEYPILELLIRRKKTVLTAGAIFQSSLRQRGSAR
jgi:two-component system cell cycle response regulator CtrA